MEPSGRFPLAIKLEIVDVEKVRGLSNYYVYIVNVMCKDGSTYHIHRRYSQFDHMQTSLEKRFLIESGYIKAKDRTLPHLPGKKLLGRSAIREVTEQRLPLLNTYLCDLMTLPDKIRYDSIVTTFFTSTSDDLAHTYTGNQAYKTRPTPQSKPLRPVKPPVKPLGAEKPPPRPSPAHHSSSTLGPPRPAPPGGRVSPSVLLPPRPAPPGGGVSPSVLLPPRPAPPGGRVSPNVPLPPKPTPPGGRGPLPPKPTPPALKGPRGKAIYSYEGMHSDELSFREGDTLSLEEEVDGGMWWKASLKGVSGLVPGNYIELIERPVAKHCPRESDEWDSSDEEGGEKGRVTCYFNGAARVVEVNQKDVTMPTYISLYKAIQKHLRVSSLVLNYKDSDGDLVQILDQEDIQLLSTDAIPPRRQPPSNRDHAPWAIYVTYLNDNSVYNIAPPR